MGQRVTGREQAASGLSPPGTCNKDCPPVGWVRSHIFLYAQAQSRESEPPTLSPAGECVPPPLIPEGGQWTHLQGGEGVGGGPNSDEGTGSCGTRYSMYKCTLCAQAS
jgi:hypothetical protein